MRQCHINHSAPKRSKRPLSKTVFQSSSSSDPTTATSLSGSADADSVTQLSSTAPSSSASASAPPPPFKIYCDLDGVLVDFGEGVRRLCGARPEQLTKSRMWSIISRKDGFYEDLPWMKGGAELWEAIRPLQPDILTGVPMNARASTEKASWCRRELGIPINHVNMAGPKSSHTIVSGRKQRDVTNVITCWSRNKFQEARQRAVLIDDRLDLGLMWEKNGGIFIHHTPGQVEPTLSKLKEHGILPTTNEADGECVGGSGTQEKLA